ncbi:MAG: hypothetical protein ABIJ05_04570 [Patescibacteria group bacterium]
MAGKESQPNKETEPPCHYIFDLTVKSKDGGNTSCYFLQVDSKDNLPSDAVNIRPVHEGDRIQIRYNLKEWPVEVFHFHKGTNKMSSLGFEWTGTEEKPMSESKGLKWKIQNPIDMSHFNQ